MDVLLKSVGETKELNIHEFYKIKKNPKITGFSKNLVKLEDDGLHQSEEEEERSEEEFDLASEFMLEEAEIKSLKKMYSSNSTELGIYPSRNL